MIEKLKQQVGEAMEKIAARRPGRKKLVYDKTTKTIVTVDQKGKKTKVMEMPTEETWI